MRCPPLLLLSSLSLLHCTQDPAVPARVPWDKQLLPSSEVGVAQAARGLVVARGIIHLHSVFSHDACDNNPQPGGKSNAPCNAHLRAALCSTRQDFAMITDHAGLMAETPWEDLFLRQGADEAIIEEGGGGAIVGSRLRCEDGRQVVLGVGGENALMPVGMTHHLGMTDEERRTNMNADDAAAVMRFHGAGAMVLQAHGESRSIDTLRALAVAGLDGMEVYNLHANVDPRIRSEWLGLDGLGAAAGLFQWLDAPPVSQGGPEPDLAFLSFLAANQNQLGKYDTLLGEGHHLHAMLGSDIHENTFKDLLSDGERGDSYRRLMRWFGNHLLVPRGAVLTPAVLKEALGRGRGYGVFEVFGAPTGFDFYARTDKGPSEMGDTVPRGATLRLVAPSMGLPRDLSEPPLLRLRILHVAPMATAAVEVATATVRPGQDGAAVEVTAMQPGAYRAEILISPKHLIYLLGDLGAKYDKEFPYVYANPIYVSP